MEDWQLNRNLASKDVEIGNKQIAGAIIQHSIAEQERQIAADQLDHAEAVAEFLATKFTNAELYEWMSGVLAPRLRVLPAAGHRAWPRLAQAQLAFERQEPVAGYIAADYWDAGRRLPARAPARAVDRRGITGSARLLAGHLPPRPVRVRHRPPQAPPDARPSRVPDRRRSSCSSSARPAC